MFEKKTHWSVCIRFNSQLRVWGYWLRAYERGSSRYFVLGPTATEVPETAGQARNQLETSRGAKSFLRGAQSF